jgi:capsular polysaccharide export protein
MNITIFTISNEKTNFFIRVANSIIKNHELNFITTRYSSYKIIKDAGYKVNMLQNFIKDDMDISEFKKFEYEAILMDVKAGFLSEKVAKEQFRLLSIGFKNYLNINNVDKFILWNGSMLQGFTASIVAEAYNINKIFFEVGNFPNKIFIDEKGVNAKSSLMDKDLSICDNYDEEKITKFLKDHKKKKEKLHIVPQAKKRIAISFNFLFNRVYNIFSKYNISETNSSILNIILKKVNYGSISINFDQYNITTKDFIFLPLQVSTDSQVIRNSDVDLYDSIEYALKMANENNLNLLIKPHPAEVNTEILEFIYQLKKKRKNIFLINDNTYLLIKYSKIVITINSTVGIEALMYYKPVILLGSAFFKLYCSSDILKVDKVKINKFLYNYIFNILKNASFFDNSSICNSTLKDFL